MICDEIREQMERILDGDWTIESRQTFDSHLATCSDCSADWNSLNETEKWLQQLADQGDQWLPKVAVPSGLAQQALVRYRTLNPKISQKSKKTRVIWFQSAASVAVAAAVFGMVVQLGVFDGDQGVLPPEQFIVTEAPVATEEPTVTTQPIQEEVTTISTTQPTYTPIAEPTIAPFQAESKLEMKHNENQSVATLSKNTKQVNIKTKANENSTFEVESLENWFEDDPWSDLSFKIEKPAIPTPKPISNAITTTPVPYPMFALQATPTMIDLPKATVTPKPDMEGSASIEETIKPNTVPTPAPTPFSNPTELPFPTEKVETGTAKTVDKVSVKFAVSNCITSMGTNCYVVGSFNDWKTGSALLLSPANYPTWSGTFEFDANQTIEYKIIKMDSKGMIIWESGSNRAIKLADQNTTENISWK